jgi:predicted DCC family thiol-disulfide oxidoreductase YuxK
MVFLTDLDHAEMMPAPAPVVVFDTDCVLCSGMVAFVLAHERDSALNFVGAWSDVGLDLARQYGFSRADLDQTFLVLDQGRALSRSDAGLALVNHLRAPWRWLAILRVVPKIVRDAAYSVVARHRYRWFGQRRDCTIVPPHARDRFIGVAGGTSGA